MGLFGSSRAGQGAPAESTKPASVALPDPGLDPEDPRQIFYQLAEAVGLGFSIVARQPVEQTLDAIVRTIPALLNSEVLTNGLQKLETQPTVLWAALDGPQGSAVVIMCGPDNDVNFLTTHITMKLRELPAPLEWSLCTRGSVQGDFVPVIASADVVSVTGLPSFESRRGVGGEGVLPATFHRAAQQWSRLGYALYSRPFRTPRGDDVTVFAGLSDSPGFPELMIRVDFVNDDQRRAIEAATRGSDARLQGVQGVDFLTFATRLPTGISSPERLDACAEEHVAQWWRIVGGVQGFANPAPQERSSPPVSAPPPVARPLVTPSSPVAPAAIQQTAPTPAQPMPPVPQPVRSARRAPASPGVTAGANLSLSKKAPGLQRVVVGLGWDTANTGAPFDLDASAIALGNDRRAVSDAHMVFFNNLRSPDGSIVHSGDNLTGEGDGDDERISIDLVALSPEVVSVVFTASIYEADTRRQTFRGVVNSYIRVVDASNDAELARFDLTDVVGSETAMVFGEVYRRDAEWKFRAIGQGYASGLAGIATDYGIDVG